MRHFDDPFEAVPFLVPRKDGVAPMLNDHGQHLPHGLNGKIGIVLALDGHGVGVTLE